MIFAFSPSGAGAFLAILVCMVLLFLLIMSIYGISVGFVGYSQWTSKNKRKILLFSVLLILLMTAFPPMRKKGDWRDDTTNLPISPSERARADRFWFGYFPSYLSIEKLGDPVEDMAGDRVQIEAGGNTYRIISAYWALDWWYVGLEVWAFFLLFLFALRNKHPKD